MESITPPPDWMLPDGVNASLWVYAHTTRLAQDEDDYFASAPLFVADAASLDAWFLRPGRLIDLGCGAGRHSIQFAQRGFEVVAVDLSHAMLQVVGAKAERRGLAVGRVEANLCTLSCFPDRVFDYAVSMFSTLGMIRTHQARGRALAEAFRILKPGGVLALHAHNLWLNLRDPQGRSWLLGQMAKLLLARADAGDRRMTYRGIPGMEVHLFRGRELRRLLTEAGFVIESMLPIDTIHARPIARPWLLPDYRAGGWLILARRPEVPDSARSPHAE